MQPISLRHCEARLWRWSGSRQFLPPFSLCVEGQTLPFGLRQIEIVEAHAGAVQGMLIACTNENHRARMQGQVDSIDLLVQDSALQHQKIIESGVGMQWVAPFPRFINQMQRVRGAIVYNFRKGKLVHGR